MRWKSGSFREERPFDLPKLSNWTAESQGYWFSRRFRKPSRPWGMKNTMSVKITNWPPSRVNRRACRPGGQHALHHVLVQSVLGRTGASAD
jgi:hypothetical protein